MGSQVRRLPRRGTSLGVGGYYAELGVALVAARPLPAAMLQTAPRQLYRTAMHEVSKTGACQIWAEVDGKFAAAHDRMISQRLACVLMGTIPNAAVSTSRSDRRSHRLRAAAAAADAGQRCSVRSRGRDISQSRGPLLPHPQRHFSGSMNQW